MKIKCLIPIAMMLGLGCKSKSENSTSELKNPEVEVSDPLAKIRSETKKFQQHAADFYSSNPQTKEMTASQKDLLILAKEVSESPVELTELTVLSKDIDDAINAQDEKIAEVQATTTQDFKSDEKVSRTTTALPAVLLVAGILGGLHKAGAIADTYTRIGANTFRKINTMNDHAFTDPITTFLYEGLGQVTTNQKVQDFSLIFSKIGVSALMIGAGIAFLATKSSAKKDEQVELYNNALSAVGLTAGIVTAAVGTSQLLQVGLEGYIASKNVDEYVEEFSSLNPTKEKAKAVLNSISPGRMIAGVLGVGLGVSMIVLSSKTMAETQKIKKKRLESLANKEEEGLSLADDKLSPEAHFMYYLSEMGDSLARIKELQAQYCSQFKVGDEVAIPCY